MTPPGEPPRASPPGWGPYACPCCKLLTLEARGQFQICAECSWEDDGQDDPNADEVWGGPNGADSLTDARRRYTMPEQTPRAVADNGRIQSDTINGTYEASQRVLDDLQSVGVSCDDVVRVLEDEGIAKFTASGNELFEQLDAELQAKRPADWRAGHRPARPEGNQRLPGPHW